MDTFFFILKVLLLSLGISIAIKYLAPFLQIPPTPVNVLVAVILPTLIMAIVLIARGRNSSTSVKE